LSSPISIGLPQPEYDSVELGFRLRFIAFTAANLSVANSSVTLQANANRSASFIARAKGVGISRWSANR
jgi:hypothetical protein